MSRAFVGYAPNQAPNKSEDFHPWISALDAFEIPFFCYDHVGRRCYTSRAATPINEFDSYATVGQQADAVASVELSESIATRVTGCFSLKREIPSARGTMLAVHPGRITNGTIGVVIVIRPARQTVNQSDALPGLSPREREVATLLATGLATKEVAHRLNISAHTARHHTEKVFVKLGVRNRSAVASILSRG